MTIPEALSTFCDGDTDSGIRTIIGPIVHPRAPAIMLARAKRTHRVTIPPKWRDVPGSIPPEWGDPELSLTIGENK